jgi:cysteinyl-tRNA synthetase
MGKSLGNSSYLRDLYKQYAPLTLRFTILQSHYRSTTEFKHEAIEAADTGYQKLLTAYSKLSEKVGKIEKRDLNESERASAHVKQFMIDMDDDFNTPKALAVLYDLAKETNTALTDNKALSELESLWHVWNALAGDVLGILPERSATASSSNADVSDLLMKLIISWRKEARENKNFEMADTIRKELLSVGVVLEDGKDGTTWKVE